MIEDGYSHKERGVHAFLSLLLPHTQRCYVALLWFIPQGFLRCGTINHAYYYLTFLF